MLNNGDGFTLKGVGLHCKSNFQPPSRNHFVEAYVELVCGDVERLKKNFKSDRVNNLTTVERDTLRTLADNPLITIKPADKGGAVVVMDSTKYKAEILRQLDDGAVYERLSCNPTFRFQKELQLVISDSLAMGLIDHKLAEFLIIESPVIPVLYVLPKIHKDLYNPPGRPIVSGRGSLFNHVAIFLDRVLRIYATSAKSYIRDTGDFLNKIENIIISDSTILASFDVVSLYTSIEHGKGLEAVSGMLSGSDVAPECARLILTLLEFILRRNFFLFGDEFFLQLRGTAMGSNVAPTYANIYMAVLEDVFVYSSNLWRHVRAWWRYIDDIFVVWEGTSLELETFHGFLNQIYPELQFTLTQSTTQIQFLDTLVYKAGSRLETDIFIKTTDRNGLLAFDSNHPRRMVGSLPWSQLLRVRRIVSDEERIDLRLSEMCNKFIARGYPPREVIKYKNKAYNCSRASIRNKTRVGSIVDRIPFVSTYNSASSRVGNILRRHWPLLQRGLPSVSNFEAPPMMSFRRGRNLRDKLVKSDIGTSKKSIQSTLSTVKNGNFPCLGCSCCNNMLKGEFFHHPHTGKKIFLKERYTCTSSFVVYMIVCPCGLTYIVSHLCQYLHWLRIAQRLQYKTLTMTYKAIHNLSPVMKDTGVSALKHENPKSSPQYTPTPPPPKPGQEDQQMEP
ncbi:unnamed protein product [Ranitomeya imitator]|uniref:Reverse transcriptase domain-containing protein n=1 Tax=Ranitomeya imitator TaxID=111125 RepID=A0ABN9L312_9NEOB|nr:unnamed protein product [Ranitomeya imitator]